VTTGFGAEGLVIHMDTTMTNDHHSERTAASRRPFLTVVLVLATIAAVFGFTNQDSVATASAAAGGRDSVVFVDGGGGFDVFVDVVGGGGVGRLSFGDVGDVPLMGDWDCDGTDSPGVYRSSVGRVFVRNAVSSGAADRVYSFGAAGDVPLVGDFDGDGCDTVSLYRPSVGQVFIANSLNGAVSRSHYFGNPGDRPFVGDFDGDGVDTVGLHRVTTGLVYFRNTNSGGFADFSFMFGDPGDRVIAGDWDGDGDDTVAAYRRSNGVLYVKNTNSTGVADTSVRVGSYVYAIAASGIPASIGTSSPVAAPAPPSVVYVPDVHVYPGDDLSDAARSYSSGTVFMVHGTQWGESVKPKSGQVFVGAPGAVLDGQNSTSYAFSGSATDVVVQGFEVRNYSTRKQFGAVHTTGSGWIIESNNIHHNAGAGVSVDKADRAVIRNNSIHHQHQLGIAVRYSTGTLVEGNEIAFNNWLKEYDWGWEAGGSKFWNTDGLVVRGNNSHHNHGPGLWDDHNNINILYEDNLIEDNYANGIFHEISYKATIRNNTIRRNGFGHTAWLWGAGILIATSQNTEVYGNLVEDNFNGITITQQQRGSDWRAYNNTIHHNIVRGGASGAVSDDGDNTLFENNRFYSNTYYGSTTWAWDGKRPLNWSQWQNTGNDTNGTHKP
jgi:parallel beta-helix repeat protein